MAGRVEVTVKKNTKAAVKADKARHHACWILRDLARSGSLTRAAAQVLLDTEENLFYRRRRGTCVPVL